MPNSTQIADGQDALAAQYNNLRADVLDATTGHDHDGTSGGGKKVDHANLAESAAMSTYTHAEIDTHIDAGAGAHGLNAAVKLMGCGPNQLVAVAGTKADPLNIDYGNCYFSEDGLAPADITLTSVIAILLTCKGPTGNATAHNDIPEWIAVNAAAGSFTYEIDHAGGLEAAALSFVVIGKK